jgi:pimeloyl-ACP methyl ester carboxylesterase
MRARRVETSRGIKCRVREWGEGAPLVYLHGAGGLFDEEPMLEALGRHRHVLAPEWPGYGEEESEGALEDMLDFALHGWDVIDALALPTRPLLVGHSMGGMIAAEMACLAPDAIAGLALLAPAGLWLDEHPIPDLFATLPFELGALLFHDPAAGVKKLSGGVDWSDMEALQKFLVQNARRLGTAGKILFPIPNRRLAKRLYRLRTRTLIVWGREDRFIPPIYAERFGALLPHAELSYVERAGHMLTLEQPDAIAETLGRFAG